MKIDINAAPNLGSGAQDAPFQAADFNTAGAALQMGAQVAGDLGTKMQEARIRVDTRRDVVNRTRATQQFKTAVDEEYQRRLVEGDLTDPAQAEEFRQFVRNTATDYIGNHGGSPDSMASLTMSLDEISGQYTRDFSREVTAAGYKFVSDDMKVSMAETADLAAKTGDYQSAMEVVEDIVFDKSSALRPGDEREMETLGKKMVVSSVFDRFTAEGNFEQADALLNDKDIAALYKDAPKEWRDMRNVIRAEQFRVNDGVKRANDKLAEIARLEGITPEQARTKYGAGLVEKMTAKPDGPQTLQEWAGELTEVRGFPPTADEITKKAGGFIKDPAEASLFGSGMPGLAMTRLTNDAAAFEQGLLTEEGERRYIAAATVYLQPIQRRDELGNIEEITPNIPPFVTQALEARGFSVEQLTGGATQEGTQEDSAGVGVDYEQTLFGQAEMVTGSGALKGSAFGVPVVGEFVEGQQEASSMRRFETQKEGLIKALTLADRYVASEANAIREAIDLPTGVFSRSQDLQSALIGVRDALEQRVTSLNSIIEKRKYGQVGAKEAQAAFELRNKVESFLGFMGVPPEIKDDSGYKDLPVGARYIDPNGDVRIKGEAQ